MLNAKQLRERVKCGELVISVFARLSDPSLAEMMAVLGADIVMIDNEHYPFDPETMINVIRAVQAAGACCLVRLPRVNHAQIAQVMDMGADGIQIPSVDTYEEARALVDAVKFPPVGKRGFCPITRAAEYGTISPVEFARKSNDNSFVITQIETKEGIENLEEILSIPEVDSMQLGPSDISASYGCPGEYSNPLVVNALARAREIARKKDKKCCEMYQSPKDMAAAYARGERFLSIGSDQQILTRGLQELVGVVQEWKTLQNKNEKEKGRT